MNHNIKDIINKIIDSPQLYLIEYYDDLKTKVDVYFETELQKIQNILTLVEKLEFFIKNIKKILNFLRNI